MENNNKRFSANLRMKNLEEMSSSKLDILIIGGGITGSGIALDAVSRGYKVGLVEKQDFGSGTSSRSGKLIHGGLKYLKQGDLPVIREVGRERAIVHENSKHLVIPVQMLFPIVKNGSFNKVTLKIGLASYDKLAGVKKEERHYMLTKKEVFEQEPLLNDETVSGGGMYIEYRTDDSRLTLEVAKTAHEHGALLCNYAEVIDIIKDQQGQAIGVRVKEMTTGRTFEIFAKYIVNAGGPWVDMVRQLNGPISGKRIHLAKGIHLVVPFSRFPVNESIYFDAAGRMIAVVPRDGCTYIGSTETDYHDDLDDVRVDQEDVDYLLDCINGMFPTVKLTEQDITSSWAGLRPLIQEEGKQAAELSRKDEIFEADSGLITIAGGKLTGYRKMAERVLDYIINKGELAPSPSQTAEIKLTGGKFNHYEELLHLSKSALLEFLHFDITEELVKEYFYRYGTNTPKLFNIMKELISNETNEHKEFKQIAAAAEILYTMEHEMVVRLTDFFDRRTGYLLFNRNMIPEIIDVVIAHFSKELNLSEKQIELEKQLLNYEFHKRLDFLSSKTHS